MEIGGENYRSVWNYLKEVPFSLGYVNAGGIRTRYLQAGRKDAPTLVLLHGMNGSLECFCANIGPYSEHFNVIAIDCLGSGFTDQAPIPVYEMPDYVKHLEDVFSALSVERMSMVGVSLGTWIALSFACKHPERVDKLVFCAGAGGRQRLASQNFESLQQAVRTRSNASSEPTWDNVKKVLEGVIHDPADVLPDFVKVRQSAFSRPAAKEGQAKILGIAKDEVFARNHLTDSDYEKIETPTLIFIGGHDEDRIKENSEVIAALMPNGQAIHMPDVAHWAQFEGSEIFNAKSIEFLRS